MISCGWLLDVSAQYLLVERTNSTVLVFENQLCSAEWYAERHFLYWRMPRLAPAPDAIPIPEIIFLFPLFHIFVLSDFQRDIWT